MAGVFISVLLFVVTTSLLQASLSADIYGWLPIPSSLLLCSIPFETCIYVPLYDLYLCDYHWYGPHAGVACHASMQCWLYGYYCTRCHRPPYDVSFSHLCVHIGWSENSENNGVNSKRNGNNWHWRLYQWIFTCYVLLVDKMGFFRSVSIIWSFVLQKSGLCFSRWKIDSVGWLHNKQGETERLWLLHRWRLTLLWAVI